MTFHAKRANPRGAPSPLVEAVTKHKGDWSVENKDWGGSTNNLDHEMYVPLSDEPCAQCEEASHAPAIRGHELMHAKLSPESFGPITVRVGDKEIPVSSALVEVAEEYRINHSLARVEGEGIIETGWCHPSIKPGVFTELDQGKFTEVIKLAVAGGPGADVVINNYLYEYQNQIARLFEKPDTSEGVKKQIKKKLKVVEALVEAIPAYSAAAARIMETAGKKLPSWSQTEQLAAFLEANLKEFDRKLKNLMTDPPPDLEKMQSMVADYDGDSKSLEPEGKVEKDGEKLVMSEGKKGLTVEDVRWGKVSEITEANMPLSIPAWKLQKQNRAVEEGTIPRYMHRWPTDKRVFHRTRKLEGGTLLVDDSGSMGLTPEELEEILNVVPLATVAVYAGRDGADGGEIRVVAKDGKRAVTEDLSLPYGGNGIDGPALEWLGKQSYPRVWITDGGVTDKTFGFSKEVVEAATRLVIKNKVTVAESAEEAAHLLKTKQMAR